MAVLALFAVTLTAPQGVAAQTSTTIRLDSSTIAESGARTLAELLAARVPGANVTWLSGAPGFAPQVTLRGAPGGTGSGRPVLIVDGVALSDDEHWVTDGLDGHRPAHHWNLPLTEIHEVEVVLGAAGGAFLQLGSSRGAVLVTTRRPTDGAWQFRQSARVDAAAPSPAVRPANTRLGNYTAGGVTNVCTLLLESGGECTPTGPARIAPFGGGNPFARSSGGQVALSGSGGIGATKLRVAAVGDVAVGALDDRMQRLDFHAAAERSVSSRVTLSGHLRAAVMDGDYAGYVETRTAGTAMRVGVDSGFGTASPLPDVAQAYRSTRLQGQVESRIALGRRGVARVGLQHEILGRENETTLADRVDLARQVTTLTAEYSVERVLRPSLAASLRVAGWHRMVDHDERAPGTTIGLDYNATALALALGLRSAGTRTLDVGLRTEAQEDQPSWPAAKTPLAFASAAWNISDETWMPRVPLLPRWRLQAAYGESTDESAFVDAVVSGFLEGSLGLSEERALEREVGLEAATEGGAVTLGARLFERRVTGSHMYVPVAAPVGFAQRLRSDIPIETFGGELSLRITRELPALGRLDALLWVARAQSRYGDTNYPLSLIFIDGFVMSPVGSGERYGGITRFTYSYADTSGDGLLSPDEVTVSGLAGTPSSWPTQTAGLTLALRGNGGWQLGATFDGKFGFRRADSEETLRCLLRICADQYDPTTSLERQAEISEIQPATYRGDFVRLRELWVRYRVRSTSLPPMAISLVGQQLLTWTQYPGLDPEVTSFFRPGIAVGEAFQEPLRPSLQLRIDVGAP